MTQKKKLPKKLKNLMRQRVQKKKQNNLKQIFHCVSDVSDINFRLVLKLHFR